MSASMLPIASGRTAWRVARAMLRPRRAALVVAIVLLAASAGAALLVPAALGRLVDAVGDARDPGAALVAVGVQLVAGVVGSAVLAAFGAIALAAALETALARLRERFVAAALSLPPATVDEIADGELVSRSTDDVETVGTVTTAVAPVFAGAAFAVIATGVGMTVLHPLFLVALLTVIPVHAFALRAYLRRAPRMYAAERVAVAARSRELLAAVRTMPTLHAFGWTGVARRRIARESWNVVRWALVTRVVQSRLGFRLNMAEAVGLGSVLLAGAWLAATGAASVGEVTTAALFFLALFGPFGALLFLVDDLQAAAASLTRVVGVIELGESGPRAEHATRRTDGAHGADTAPDSDSDRPAASAAVLVTDLRAGYRGRADALHGVDLEVPSGQWLALVGPSGAGKTTLARALTGALPARAGAVRLAGADPIGLDEDARARHVVMVGQDVHVFSGTLRDNLRIARDDASDDELRRVLDAISGDGGWRRDFPDGLDTLLGDGHDATGPVAAHRIALARVALTDAPVVVLDEATADADTRDARDLDAAARRLLDGRTVIVIAHRLDQARDADRVIVLADGRIAEDGAHADLVAAEGPYARLWEAWSAERR